MYYILRLNGLQEPARYPQRPNKSYNPPVIGSGHQFSTNPLRKGPAEFMLLSSIVKALGLAALFAGLTTLVVYGQTARGGSGSSGASANGGGGEDNHIVLNTIAEELQAQFRSAEAKKADPRPTFLSYEITDQETHISGPVLGRAEFNRAPAITAISMSPFAWAIRSSITSGACAANGFSSLPAARGRDRRQSARRSNSASGSRPTASIAPPPSA